MLEILDFNPLTIHFLYRKGCTIRQEIFLNGTAGRDSTALRNFLTLSRKVVDPSELVTSITDVVESCLSYKR